MLGYEFNFDHENICSWNTNELEEDMWSLSEVIKGNTRNDVKYVGDYMTSWCTYRIIRIISLSAYNWTVSATSLFNNFLD